MSVSLLERVFRIATTGATVVVGTFGVEKPAVVPGAPEELAGSARRFYCSAFKTWDEQHGVLQPRSSCFSDSECPKGYWCDNLSGQPFRQDEAWTVVCGCVPGGAKKH